MSKIFIRNIFFIFHLLGMVLYCFFDLYGGIQGSTLDLDFSTQFQIFAVVFCICSAISVFSSLLIYQIEFDESLILWRALMTGIGVALFLDQISLLIELSFPYSLYALGILCFFAAFFTRMVYRNHTSKGRMIFLLLVFAALMAKLDPSVEHEKDDRDERPNVILVSIDALHADILEEKEIQNLRSFELLRENGVSFSNMHAACDQPKCSYQALMTADIPLYETEKDLPLSYFIHSHSQTFSAMDYETAAFLGASNIRDAGLKKGFSTYDDEFSWIRGWSISFWGRLFPFGSSMRSSMNTTDMMLSWSSRQKKPFFAWLQYSELQAPYNPPVEWEGHFFDGDPYELHTQECMNSLAQSHHQSVQGRCSASWLTSQYKGELASLDRELFRVLKWVQENPNTLLVFVGGYGVHLSHTIPWFGRDGLTKEGTHVPAIFWFPDILAQGKEIASLSSTMDIFPTIFDILGVPLESKTVGVSQVDAIYNGVGSQRIQGLSTKDMKIYEQTDTKGWQKRKSEKP